LKTATRFKLDLESQILNVLSDFLDPLWFMYDTSDFLHVDLYQGSLE